VTALIHVFSKMDDGGRQICGLLPVLRRHADNVHAPIFPTGDGILGAVSELWVWVWVLVWVRLGGPRGGRHGEGRGAGRLQGL